MNTESRSPREKLILIFEAAKRSLVAYDRIHRRLWANLRNAQPVIRKRAALDDLAEDVFIDCVALVDFAHRFAQLIDALPLVSKKQPSLRILLASMSEVEGARNHLQHMRGDLSSPLPIDYPILGSIAWASDVDDSESFILAFEQARKAEQFGLVVDRENMRYVRKIEYTVKNFAVDFDAVSGRMHRAYEEVTSQLQFSPPEFGQLTWGTSIGASITFRLADTESGES